MSETDGSRTTEELTSDEKREHVIRLAFGGSEDRFNEFVEAVRQAIPPGTGQPSERSTRSGRRQPRRRLPFRMRWMFPVAVTDASLRRHYPVRFRRSVAQSGRLATLSARLARAPV